MAFVAHGVGNVAAYAWQTLGIVGPLRWLSNILFLLFVPLLVAGLLRFPHVRSTRRELVTFSLDVAIVVCAGIVSVLLLDFGAPPGRTAIDGWRQAHAVVYLLGDVILLVGATMLWLRQPNPRLDHSLTLLALALAILMVADVVHAYRLAHGLQGNTGVNAAWALTMLLLAVSAVLQRWEARHAGAARLPGTSGRASGRFDTPGSSAATAPIPALLPYVACAVVCGLTVAAVIREGGGTVWLPSLGAVMVTTLVLARQWVAVRENLQLSTAAALHESDVRVRALVQHSSDMLLVIDRSSAIRYASPAAVQQLGGEARPLEGRLLLDLVHPEDQPAAAAMLAQAAGRARQSVRAAWRLSAADGRTIPAEHVATNLLDEPSVEGIVLNARDVSERAELERQLAHQAFHDPLTQLANRTLFLDRLEHAYCRTWRSDIEVALLFLDLDDFKRVNDSLGHAAGDALLVMMSARIVRELRESDTLARLGGDEFAILVAETGGLDVASTIAERIGKALHAPFVVEGREIVVGVSIGVASSRQAQSPAELMRIADLAMYIAKTSGKGGSAFYEPHMHSDVVLRVDLEADLRRALERDELTLVFQPVIQLDHRQLVGVEALVRWEHEMRGSIMPTTFIPIAEESGLIVPLGRWVLREACRQARHWLDETGLPLQVGVNLSGRHLQDPSLVADVRHALEAAGLAPAQLLIEITESTLMQDPDDVARVLHELKALGVTLALDDFGTGYSSLSYLQRFPIDVLKIDRSFVAAMSHGSCDSRLVRSIVALGHSLDMRIVAEGVETETQLAMLRALGCSMGQGYLFARPMAPDRIPALLVDAHLLTPSGPALRPSGPAAQRPSGLARHQLRAPS
ncbi:MAG: EAL domain-containing protein [Gemmatimonadaceae bacterium]